MLNRGTGYGLGSDTRLCQAPVCGVERSSSVSHLRIDFHYNVLTFTTNSDPHLLGCCTRREVARGGADARATAEWVPSTYPSRLGPQQDDHRHHGAPPLPYGRSASNSSRLRLHCCNVCRSIFTSGKHQVKLPMPRTCTGLVVSKLTRVQSYI